MIAARLYFTARFHGEHLPGTKRVRWGIQKMYYLLPFRFLSAIRWITAGIYAVGDVRAASIKRVASAVGEGSVVISDVHRYLALHREALATHA